MRVLRRTQRTAAPVVRDLLEGPAAAPLARRHRPAARWPSARPAEWSPSAGFSMVCSAPRSIGLGTDRGRAGLLEAHRHVADVNSSGGVRAGRSRSPCMVAVRPTAGAVEGVEVLDREAGRTVWMSAGVVAGDAGIVDDDVVVRARGRGSSPAQSRRRAAAAGSVAVPDQLRRRTNAATFDPLCGACRSAGESGVVAATGARGRRDTAWGWPLRRCDDLKGLTVGAVSMNGHGWMDVRMSLG